MSHDPLLLVVDDNEDNRYTLTQRLARLGYRNVETAADGDEALARLRQARYDLMLLDVMMPGLNGYQVLEHLKADERLRDVPVIMISAVDQVESVVRCIELGAEDYLQKPFNPILLRARVGACLEKKRLRDETSAHLARVEAELRSARAIQLGLVPDEFPAPTAEVPVDVFAALFPAREVGGDLYDFFHVDARVLCMVVADVSDKGAAAALFMAHASSMIRVVSMLLRTRGGRATPAEVLARVNDELCRGNRACMFVTVFFAMLDLADRTLSFCNAGHNVPFLMDAAGRITPLEGGRGRALAVRRGVTYEDVSRRLAPADTLFLYTDGITEAVNASGEFFDDERLRESLRALAGCSAQELVRGVVERVRAFAGTAPQSDDIAALAVRLLGDGAGCGGTVEIAIANRPDELPRAAQALEAFAAEHALPSDALADLQVVLDEVLSNILRYAYADDEAHEIRVVLHMDGEQIEAQIEDDGVAFNPLDLPAPDTKSPLGRRRVGGLGVHLVRNLMTRVSYARIGERNRLTLIRHLSKRKESDHGNH